MSGTVMNLLILESVVTALAIAMLAYRAMLDMKEEDHIILDAAESHLARDQASIRQKVTTISKYIKVVAITWSVLLVVIFGVWLAQGLNLI